MSVQSSDIIIYKSASADGGVISAVKVTGSKHSLIPAVTQAQRTSGAIRYYKIFFRNENTDDLGALEFLTGISQLSTGGDYFRLNPGTDTDIQSVASGYTDWAGSGLLNADANSGASSFDVDYDAADGVYAGSTIRISDGTNTEFHTVDTVSWNGTTATITLDGTTLANGYASATPTVVSTIVSLGTLKASFSGWTENSSAGTYDESAYPLIVYNKGTVKDTWTVTKLAGDAFSVSGAVTGSVGTGLITQDFKPINGSSWYFNLRSAGWGGTWAENDTLQFITGHAAKSLWLKQTVPASIPGFTGSSMKLLMRFTSE